MASQIEILKERVNRNQSDIRDNELKITDYQTEQAKIMAAIAALPTKDDFRQLTKEVTECVGTERKRIDTLYLRDTLGTVIAAAIGAVGIALSVIFAVMR